MPDEKPLVVDRLSEPMYAKLESLLPKPMVQPGTTDIQAGYLMGIQHVLSVLRTGFVYGT
jgi:hypothetical protein